MSRLRLINRCIVSCLTAVSLLLCTGACSSLHTSDPYSLSATSKPDITWPPPPQQARIKFVGSISGPADIGIKRTWIKNIMDQVFGSEETSVILLRPYGVWADSNRIYVTDPGRFAVHVFDISQKKYFPIYFLGEERFISPIGISVDRNGEIFVTDSLLHRVAVFDSKGEYQRDIGSPDIFQRPAGIAIDRDKVYVIDTLAHRVSVLSKHNGGLLFHFGRQGTGEGEFNYPTNIFLHSDNLLYITDSMNFRVQVFDKEGKFVCAFGRLGNGSGDFSKPKGIAVDSDKNIYVSDAHFDNIQIFDISGKLLLAFGTTGQGPGEMVLPAGVYIDGSDKIYVADSYNKRIQIFQYIKARIAN